MVPRHHDPRIDTIAGKPASGADVLAAVPARRGHFVLESGYHTDVWLDLDEVFVEPALVSGPIAALAAKLERYAASAVCGPLLGGAFLAQALALTLGTRFFYAEPLALPGEPGLFKAEYRLPARSRHRARGERVVVVDDVISAGSSVRATVADLESAGASVVALGAFLVLGDVAAAYFTSRRTPVEMLAHRDFSMWPPDECPLCRTGSTLESPRAAPSHA